MPVDTEAEARGQPLRDGVGGMPPRPEPPFQAAEDHRCGSRGSQPSPAHRRAGGDGDLDAARRQGVGRRDRGERAVDERSEAETPSHEVFAAGKDLEGMGAQVGVEGVHIFTFEGPDFDPRPGVGEEVSEAGGFESLRCEGPHGPLDALSKPRDPPSPGLGGLDDLDRLGELEDEPARGGAVRIARQERVAPQVGSEDPRLREPIDAQSAESSLEDGVEHRGEGRSRAEPIPEPAPEGSGNVEGELSAHRSEASGADARLACAVRGSLVHDMAEPYSMASAGRRRVSDRVSAVRDRKTEGGAPVVRGVRFSSRPRVSWCVGLALWVLVSGCGREPLGGLSMTTTDVDSVRPPEVVLIFVLERLDRDRLRRYGSDPGTMDGISGVLRRGSRFPGFASESTDPAVSIASVWTGHRADVHGVGRTGDALDPEIPTLPERFRAGGFRTLGWVSAPSSPLDAGYRRGFDEVTDRPIGVDDPLFREWSESREGEPTLLVATFSGEGLSERDGWQDLDSRVRGVAEALGDRRALISVVAGVGTSDAWRGLPPAEDVTPGSLARGHFSSWVLAGGGVLRGRYPQLARTVDVLPTLLTLAGLETTAFDEDRGGRDLSAAMRGEIPPPAQSLLLHGCRTEEDRENGGRRAAVQLMDGGRVLEVRLGASGDVEDRRLIDWRQPNRTDRSDELLSGPPVGDERRAAAADLRLVLDAARRLHGKGVLDRCFDSSPIGPGEP